MVTPALCLLTLPVWLGLARGADESPPLTTPAEASPTTHIPQPAPVAPTPEAVPADPIFVFHVPPATALKDAPLELQVTTKDLATAGRLELWYRRIGTEAWTAIGLNRKGSNYVVVIPKGVVSAPGVEYALLDHSGSTSTPVFATLTDPHRVLVEGDSVAAMTERRLAARYGQRSRFESWGGAQSFGKAPGRGPDYYWNFGAAYTYRALGILHNLRFGFERMRGETPGWFRKQGTQQAGFDRGFAQAEFSPIDPLGLRVGAEIGADLQQFRGGGQAAVRVGNDTGTHLWAWLANTSAVGGSFGASLTWDTLTWDRLTGTPGRPIPMTAAVDVTNWPSDERYAVRLRTGIDLPVGEHLGFQLQASYQARTALAGGPGGQLGASWAF
jgi:hypothetical protein